MGRENSSGEESRLRREQEKRREQGRKKGRHPGPARQAAANQADME